MPKPPVFKPLMWPEDFGDERDWEELSPFERELVEQMARARPSSLLAILDEFEKRLGEPPPDEAKT